MICRFAAPCPTPERCFLAGRCMAAEWFEVHLGEREVRWELKIREPKDKGGDDAAVH